MKAKVTQKLFNINGGEVYQAYIEEGNDFTIALITENGETTAYYTADLIDSLEEWEEGSFNLEAVGDDFIIEWL